MKNVTEIIKGAYELDTITLGDIAKCVRDYLERYNNEPTFIWMEPKNALAISRDCAGYIIRVQINPAWILKLEIRQDESKKHGIIFIA